MCLPCCQLKSSPDKKRTNGFSIQLFLKMMNNRKTRKYTPATMENAATCPKQLERAETTAKLRKINTNTKSRPRMAVMAIAVRILTVFSTVPSLIYSFCRPA